MILGVEDPPLHLVASLFQHIDDAVENGPELLPRDERRRALEQGQLRLSLDHIRQAVRPELAALVREAGAWTTSGPRAARDPGHIDVDTLRRVVVPLRDVTVALLDVGKEALAELESQCLSHSDVNKRRTW